MKGYVFLSVHLEKENNIKYMMIKSNLDFVILDQLIDSTGNIEAIQRMASWIEDPLQYRFVANSLDEFHTFTNAVLPYIPKLPRDFLRIIKSRFWNIPNEMSYRLKCPSNFKIQEYMELYGLSEIVAENPLSTECLRLYALTNVFHSDKKTTSEISRSGYLKVFRDRLSELSFDTLFDRAIRKYQSLSFKQSNQNEFKVEATDMDDPIVIEDRNPKEVLIKLLMRNYEKI